jgi:pSer/pThr/pTyr-binding forkhead associated (FHA) protein
MPFFLKIVAGVEAAQTGVKFPLAQGSNLVGRVVPPCTILLEGKKVSKKHCDFLLQGEILKVEDLGSSNGLYVNGKKVSSAVLKPKDRLVVGEYTLEIAVG